MRSLLSLFKLLPIILFSFLITGCSDDNEGFDLRRDTDKLSFSYANSSQQFTVRTKGSWSVSSNVDWLSFEPATGTGNGKDYQYVTATATHNTGDERTAIITLSGGGIKSEISVTQENGHFELGEPYVEGRLLQGEEINLAYLAIPYKKAGGSEVMSAEITISGTGADGIEVENINNLVLTEGNGSAMAIISGKPTTMDKVEFTLKITIDGKQQDPITIETMVSSANLILSQYFDKLVWGGDYMKQKGGIKSNRGNNAEPDDSGAYIETCSAGADGTNNMFGTALRPKFIDANSNPRGLKGWDGWAAYERPGYIKMGTANYSGWLATPPLELEKAGGVCDLYVSFDYAMYDDAGAVVPFKVEGAGAPSTTSLSSSEKFVWKHYNIKISGARTGDVIVWGDNTVKGANNTVKNSRYLLDNIEIIAEVIEKPSGPLTAPTNITIKEINAKSLAFSWDEVERATNYRMELALKNNPSFTLQAETKEKEYKFESLIGGTDYTLKIMAVFGPDESYNSPWSEPITARTLGVVPKISTPIVNIIETTHGKIVIDWNLVEGWNDLTDRRFLVELAESNGGTAIRSYTIDETNKKYRFNRFVFGKLKENKTYYCRLQLLPRNNNKEYDPSEVVTVSTTTKSKPIQSSNVLLYKDFEDFWYGGDGSWAAFGVMPTIAMASFEESQEFIYTLRGTTNTVENIGDSFNTGSTSDSYRASRWGNGWSGLRVYEVAGYIKFGTSSADGYLTTPALTALTSPSNIEVKIDACPYTEPNGTTGDLGVNPAQENSLKFYVKVEGAGTINGASGDGKQIELKNNSNKTTNPDLDRLSWTNHTLNITGADATTRITFGTYNAAGDRRMWLDNIKIEKK